MTPHDPKGNPAELEVSTMTSTDHQTYLPEQPRDPALFAPLSTDENIILQAHLNSGWHKQSAVYPGLSAPWQETSGLLDDLHQAWTTAFDAERAARRGAELAGPEPEAGA